MHTMTRVSRLVTVPVAALAIAAGSTTTVASPTSQTSVTTRPVKIYLLHGEHLVSVHRDALVSGLQVGRAAMTTLLAGPTAAEQQAGLRTAIPSGTSLNSVTVTGRTADVDLSSRYASGGGSFSMTARLAQVVFTLTQFSTVHDVTFRLNGKRITALGGEGVIIDKPQGRAQYGSFLPPIFIDSPAWGQTIHSPLRVSGTATAFEGQFTVEVRNSAGTVLARQAAHTAMGRHVPYTATLTFTAQPGSGKVVGYDKSPKNGARIDVYAVPVRLS